MKREGETSVLEVVLPSEQSASGLKRRGGSIIERPRCDGLMIGILSDFEESGAPVVVVPGLGVGTLLKCRSIVVLDRTAVGRSVAIQFEGSDPEKPIILGLIQGPLDAMESSADDRGHATDKCVSVEKDGERLVVTADREIVLRCGKSSITLTRAGKILIRGAYLLSRSSGVNRIKGGSVQIN